MSRTLVASVLLALRACFGAGTNWVRQEPTASLHQPEVSSWILEARAPSDHPVKLSVALRLDADRRAELERIFWEVSDPKHANYGKHRSLEEVTELLSVPQERVELVKGYFEGAGASVVVAPNMDVLKVSMRAAAAEAALNTTLSFFRHANSGKRILRTNTHYALPSHVAKEVSMVGDLLQFPHVRQRAQTNTAAKGIGTWPNACDAKGCDGLVTPAVLAQRYKLPTGVGQSAPGNSMSVAEYQGEYFTKKDLEDFGKSCHVNVTVDKVIGGDEPDPGDEAELDIEYIKSVAPEVPLTVVYHDEYSLLDWVHEITGLQDPPLVHSVSYGNDEKQQPSVEFMFNCNTGFMKAGVRGISILFASGDQGVCGRQGCGLIKHAPFHPDFPGDSPYITTVGGTDFAGSDIGEETAWSDSGGGFSNYFAIPEYQKSFVAAYKASPDADLPPQELWNNSGRGYPDVAALGGLKTPYCVNVGGSFEGISGTSASCPVVAGVFAKLNGLRLAANKKPMGFLNPFIYQNPSAFQDVTSGINCATRKYGFKAIKGWDPVTGFGTPNYEALSKAAMAMYDDLAESIVV
eukprot:TRINITY_DN8589_c2_g1_i1.p1 TRINITY_DN8589_c2_g1~~TRINITY_DN8589_c2_g1_i1.p1  ORF type:complete len:576 (+),score=117.52 TRINITY_DN8589_c2_g1_i1:50-1777(+)